MTSGDCPDDAGFALNAYQTTGSMRAHLARYDRNNLPSLVSKARAAFTAANGGRSKASKIAVIFVDGSKVRTLLLMKK